MDFTKELKHKIKEAMDDVPDTVASTAQNYFIERFAKKEFDGTPWPAWSKRYQPGRGTLMMQSGRLRKSIEIDEVSARRVVITAGNDEVLYAKAHNEGFSGSVVVKDHKRTNKKGKTFVVKQHSRKMFLPQRQFLGESSELDTLIKRNVEEIFKTIIQQ